MRIVGFRRYPIVGLAAWCVMLSACTAKSPARNDSTTANGNVASADAATSIMVRGTVESATPTTIAVKTDTGTTTVQLTQPVRVYERQPAQLADMTSNTFVGVTTVKDPDGSNRATEIHIFPEELRGLGEGSRPMTAPGTGGAPSTMTNGAAVTPGSASTMTNGSASSVGTTLVVQYPGGTMKASVPANTPVTKLVATSAPLAPGERVVVISTKGAGGSLVSNRVIRAR